MKQRESGGQKGRMVVGEVSVEDSGCRTPPPHRVEEECGWDSISPVVKRAVFVVGDVVEVESRTWPGINKPGGVGKIVRDNKDGTFDVSYILGGGEKNVELKYIQQSEAFLNNSQRPVKPREFFINYRQRKQLEKTVVRKRQGSSQVSKRVVESPKCRIKTTVVSPTQKVSSVKSNEPQQKMKKTNETTSKLREMENSVKPQPPIQNEKKRPLKEEPEGAVKRKKGKSAGVAHDQKTIEQLPKETKKIHSLLSREMESPSKEATSVCEELKRASAKRMAQKFALEHQRLEDNFHEAQSFGPPKKQIDRFQALCIAANKFWRPMMSTITRRTTTEESVEIFQAARRLLLERHVLENRL